MVQNPFRYGSPIIEPEHFAGRRQEARQIFSHLHNMDSSAVLGERRIGKTSFLKYVPHPDTVREFGHDPEKYLFVFVDLQGFDGRDTPGGFWRAVLNEITTQAKDDEKQNVLAKTRAQPSLGTRELADLFDGIGRQGRRVVLLLDEFDSVTGNLNFDLDFFNSLRSLAIHHNLALITASRRELVELCHSREVAGSPFFNIFANIDLGLLTLDEAWELMDKALAGTAVIFDQVEREYLQQMTGCHPFFLQMAGHFLFEAHTRRLNEKERRSFTIEKCKRQVASHFADYWDRSNHDERSVLAALAQLSGMESGDNLGLTELEQLVGYSARMLRQLIRRGLLLKVGEKVGLFSPLLGEWIAHEVLEETG
jgi:serine/threonine-protein kinase